MGTYGPPLWLGPLLWLGQALWGLTQGPISGRFRNSAGRTAEVSETVAAGTPEAPTEAARHWWESSEPRSTAGRLTSGALRPRPLAGGGKGHTSQASEVIVMVKINGKSTTPRILWASLQGRPSPTAPPTSDLRATSL